VALLLATAVAAPLAGCESSQQRSARLERDGATLLTAEKGLDVSRQNRDVKAIESAVIQDENGAAVVVVLRNRAPRPSGRVPIAVELRGAGGRSVYRNDAPGLDPSLVEATGVPARGEEVWVNDQVTPSGRARAVEVRVGLPKGAPPRKLPRMQPAPPRLAQDEITGVEAVGSIANRSDVEQRRLVVFCVARRGGKLVAAGRAIVNRLAPGRRARYHVFFIGDPRGARLTVAAPPTVLE
jgi:hypothetical protein